MKKMISSFLCLLLLAGLIAGCGEQDGTASNAAAVDTFSVGYARVDISPTASVPMGGFGDGRMSTMVTEPLYANCIAISDKDTTVLVFTLDLTRSYSQAIPDIRSYISEQTGIPVSNIMTTASHTHSGPDLSMKTTPAIADYITALREQMLEAANAALEDRKPAALEATSIRPENMNYVRHYIMDNGTYAGSNFGSYKSGKIVGHVSKADNLMQLLKFTRDNGKDVVLVNWQGHYRVEKGTLISSDYYCILRSNLEKELDCHAAFVLGPSGNVNTRSQINTEPSILNYVEYGNKLTEYALEAAKNFVPIQTGRVEITENLYQAESVKGGNKVEYPLYALSVGDAAFVFAPYEMFDVNGISIRNNSKYHTTFIATCANTHLYYVPTEEAYVYQSYEATTAKATAGHGEIFADEYGKMLDDLYTRTGITPTPKAADYNTQPFEPASDDEVYTNLKPGDLTAYLESPSGAYIITLRGPKGVNKMLVWDAAVRDQILQSSTTKLLFDASNTIVGIAE